MAEEHKQIGHISRRSVIASAALVPVAALTSAGQSAGGIRIVARAASDTRSVCRPADS